MSQNFNPNPSAPYPQQHERSFSQTPTTQTYNGSPMGAISPGFSSGSNGASGPPQISSLPFQTSQSPLPSPYQPQASPPPIQSPYSQPAMAASGTHLSPLKPVFGLSLNELFERDGSAVPMVVYQCIQAVDLFGLELEGIYRLSGTASHITKIKAMFDNGKLVQSYLHVRQLIMIQIPQRSTSATQKTSFTMSTVLLVF